MGGNHRSREGIEGVVRGMRHVHDLAMHGVPGGGRKASVLKQLARQSARVSVGETVGCLQDAARTHVGTNGVEATALQSVGRFADQPERAAGLLDDLQLPVVLRQARANSAGS